MSANRNVSMKPDRFATAAVNLLDRAFLAASRAQSKRHFARIQGGGLLELETLRLEDGSEVAFRVTLDHGAYRGKLSYAAFRRGLTMLLGRLVERIRGSRDMNLYTSKSDSSLLFNVPAVITGEGATNVLMLGTGDPEPGLMTLRLVYLDPEQFRTESL